VEDDKRMLELLDEICKNDGYETYPFFDPEQALLDLNNYEIDIVITDLKMPKISGLNILNRVKDINKNIPVIIITAHGTIDIAVNAIKMGAYDFIQKPFQPENISIVLKRASALVNVINENKKLTQMIASLQDDFFVCKNREITEIKELSKKVATTDVPVLIVGETGTGKEMLAKLIHSSSLRKDKKFIAINCGSISEQLLESELFGHEKGAFTGAINQRKGIFEEYNGGTIFLDEINSASLNFQTKLLRVLQDGKIMRVGSSKEIDVDVRIICASNVDPEIEIENGKFRKDLYYRISLIKIKIPPLRERKDDIILLANYFLLKKSKKYGKDIKGLTEKAIHKLMSYSWPGNVRELENSIERSVILSNEEMIDNIILDEADSTKVIDINIETLPLIDLENMEKIMIKKALKQFNNHKNKSASALGIDTATLWRKIKKYNLE
jgi:DNA-binding NtrC family response regulator